MVTDKITPSPSSTPTKLQSIRKKGLADKYIDTSRSQRSKAYLGQKEKRVEEVTVGQALQVAKQEQTEALKTPQAVINNKPPQSSLSKVQDRLTTTLSGAAPQRTEDYYQEESGDFDRPPSIPEKKLDENFQVEVAPLQ